jgi:hypothetical protein
MAKLDSLYTIKKNIVTCIGTRQASGRPYVLKHTGGTNNFYDTLNGHLCWLVDEKFLKGKQYHFFIHNSCAFFLILKIVNYGDPFPFVYHAIYQEMLSKSKSNNYQCFFMIGTTIDSDSINKLFVRKSLLDDITKKSIEEMKEMREFIN